MVFSIAEFGLQNSDCRMRIETPNSKLRTPNFLFFNQIINDFSNLFKNPLFTLSGIDHFNPTRFFLGNGKVSFSHPLVELNLFSFKTPLSFLSQCLIPLERPLQSYIRRTIQKKSDIRLDALGSEAIEAINPFYIYPSAITLISEGGITETVAKYKPALFQKGLDNLFHMLRPGRFIKEEFGHWNPLMVVRVHK